MGNNGSSGGGPGGPTEQVAQYFTTHMASTINTQMSESYMTVEQHISSTQRQVGWTVSLPPKGYCPANAPPRNFTMTQRNDTAAAVAFSAQALRPDSLAKSLLNGLESATSGTVDKSSPGVLNFGGPNVNQRLTITEDTRNAVSNALGVKLGSYVSSTLNNNQEQVNINIVLPCGNATIDQSNLSKAMATDIALTTTEVLMRAPEVKKFTELLAPELPPLGVMDVIGNQMNNMPTEQIVVLIALVGVMGYFALRSEE